MQNDIEVILFDLGGVLIELGESPFPKHWFVNSEDYSPAQWFRSNIALNFERGRISPVEFAHAIKEDLDLKASPTEILTEFTQWPIGLYPGATELLVTLKDNYTLAVLSNTNELHWPRITDEFKLSHYFEHLYASHLLQVAKPEPESFTTVLDKLKVAATSVLFFDDNAENIEAAQKLGIVSHQVKGIDELRHKLTELKFL